MGYPRKKGNPHAGHKTRERVLNILKKGVKKAKKYLKKHLHYRAFSYIMAFVGGKQTAKSQQMEP